MAQNCSGSLEVKCRGECKESGSCRRVTMAETVLITFFQQWKNKEKLVKFLKGERQSLGQLERTVKVVKPAIGHEKQE